MQTYTNHPKLALSFHSTRLTSFALLALRALSCQWPSGRTPGILLVALAQTKVLVAQWFPILIERWDVACQYLQHLVR